LGIEAGCKPALHIPQGRRYAGRDRGGTATATGCLFGFLSLGIGAYLEIGLWKFDKANPLDGEKFPTDKFQINFKARGQISNGEWGNFYRAAGRRGNGLRRDADSHGVGEPGH
jgi:hypothetical protein